jgi:hypothetical protein
VCCCNAQGNTAARKAPGAVEIASMCNLGPGRGRLQAQCAVHSALATGAHGSARNDIAHVENMTVLCIV